MVLAKNRPGKNPLGKNQPRKNLLQCKCPQNKSATKLYPRTLPPPRKFPEEKIPLS